MSYRTATGTVTSGATSPDGSYFTTVEYEDFRGKPAKACLHTNEQLEVGHKLNLTLRSNGYAEGVVGYSET